MEVREVNNLYTCEFVKLAPRKHHARILRGGRVIFDGAWQTRQAAINGWKHLVEAIEAGKYSTLYPQETTRRKAKAIKRRKP